MKMTATRFRQDLFKTLDRLVETGETLEIERKGALLRLQVSPAAGGLLDTARFAHRRRLLRVPAADLVSIDWSSLWRPGGGFESPAPAGRQGHPAGPPGAKRPAGGAGRKRAKR